MDQEMLDPTPNKLTCDLCSKQFQNKARYEIHLKTHGRGKRRRVKSLECGVCGKLYSRKACLALHLKKHEGPTCACRFCDKRYSSLVRLRKHEKAHADRAFRCRLCSGGFASEAERDQHIRMEHRRDRVCPGCETRFYTDEALVRHRATSCCNETSPFICESCGKRFKLKGNLKTHSESKCGTERTYGCEDCGKMFMTRPSLATHRLLHTGEKNFVCRFCEKSHRTKGEVTRHELTHTRDKPFSCGVCQKAFAHRESLITHSTLHTGIKPYICDTCGKGFSCVGNLIKHRKNNARCMTSDTQRNRPRIKKPTLHYLQISAINNLIEPNQQFSPFGHSVALVNSPIIQYNIDDTLPTLTKPVTDLDIPDLLQRAPKESKELEVDRNTLTEDSTINNTNTSLQCDIRNCNDIWSIKPDPIHTDSSPIKFVNYNNEPVMTQKPSEALLVDLQTLASVENKTRNNRPDDPSTLPPFDDAPRNNESSKGIEGANSEGDDSRDYEGNDLGEDSCDSVLPVVVERKPEASAFEDQFLSWVKSGNDVPDEVPDTKETTSIDCVPVPVENNVEEEKIFSCPSCRKCFREESRLRWHMKTHDSRFLDAKTTEVGYLTDDDEPLADRLRRHAVVQRASLAHPCQYCPENFDNERDYKRHRRKLHADDEKPSFPCPHCPKVYKFRRALLKHETRHSIGSFRCDKCNMTYRTFKEYQHHVKTLHWKRFACEKCEHTFSSSSELNSHVKCNHDTEGKTLACDSCGKLFKHNVNLKRHVESRCGASPRYVCKTCGKSYQSQGGFDSHQLVHTGLRVFLCKFCGRDFQHKTVLLIHELTHTGEKPFVCPVCSKAFAHQISLTTHATTHSGVKPYKCEGCGAGFSCFGNLKKHRLTHMSTCSLTRIRKSK